MQADKYICKAAAGGGAQARERARRKTTRRRKCFGRVHLPVHHHCYIYLLARPQCSQIDHEAQCTLMGFTLIEIRR